MQLTESVANIKVRLTRRHCNKVQLTTRCNWQWSWCWLLYMVDKELWCITNCWWHWGTADNEVQLTVRCSWHWSMVHNKLHMTVRQSDNEVQLTMKHIRQWGTADNEVQLTTKWSWCGKAVWGLLTKAGWFSEDQQFWFPWPPSTLCTSLPTTSSAESENSQTD